MESLNEIVQQHIQMKDQYLRNRNFEVEVDLDPDMPKIYSDFTSTEGTPKYLLTILSELTNEQLDNKPIHDGSITKLRYSTLLVDNTQVLIIENDRKPIPEETLSELNTKLAQIGSGGRTAWQGRLTGNARAAVGAYKGGGVMYYENHPDWDYKVDATVILPLKV